MVRNRYIGKNLDAVGIEPTTFHKLHWMMRSELNVC
jgi:hypothetical protein